MSESRGYFGMPPLAGEPDHEMATHALRTLVDTAAKMPLMGGTAALCGRDIMAYLDHLEARARMADERVGDINRKLDEILLRLPPVADRPVGWEP